MFHLERVSCETLSNRDNQPWWEHLHYGNWQVTPQSCVLFVESLPAHHCLELFIYCPLSDLYMYMNSVSFGEPQVKMIRIMNFTIWYLALRDQGCICFEEGFLKQPLASLNKLDER